ncbi:hypothetical protein GCM10008101_22420 [Lysobacter xinjiangensis]|uniref:WD40-like Beta Propeller Repeat n=1 Tax=Cognatilysobacter xinjiangensis TaxID=546892 RepID=A0ABQ3C8M8_9GAMM|nr:TolB-like protein [Lysobacter xinjiangensis]GGZ67672.1 hypothetical protein GCM10008101_22420 [Lysobacter xinjiangensis]
MRTVHHLVPLALLIAMPCTAFAPWGMEGVGIVSTRNTELRATVHPDGNSIIWSSPDRAGGPGGGDLWIARRIDGRWQEARPLALNTTASESDPAFSADGRWLYFASDHAGGVGGNDLYRAPFVDGEAGTPQNLGTAVNTRGDERSPMPLRDGRRLLFASDGRPGAKRHDLYVAIWQGDALTKVQPVPGINTDDDESDAMWLADGDGLVFARSQDLASKPVQLLVARCRAGAYVEAAPLALAFNTEDARTLAPMPDWNRPVEMLLSGAAPSPKAGRLDVYRVLVPTVKGDGSCG